jgi:hypothetical protein
MPQKITWSADDVAELCKRLDAGWKKYFREKAHAAAQMLANPRVTADVAMELHRKPYEKRLQRAADLEGKAWRAEVVATRAKEAAAKGRAALGRRVQADHDRLEEIRTKLLPVWRALALELHRAPRAGEALERYLAKYQADESTFWRMWRKAKSSGLLSI